MQKSLSRGFSLRDSTILNSADVIAVAERGPVSAVYADILRMRIRQRRRNSMSVPQEGYGVERVNDLYFTLIRQIEEASDDEQEVGRDDVSDDDPDDCEQEILNMQGAFENESEEPLWQIIDAFCEREYWDTRNHEPDDRKQKTTQNATDVSDGPWQAFWQHYRGDGAKTTSNEVAIRRACNQKPPFTTAQKSGVGSYEKRIGAYSKAASDQKQNKKAIQRSLTVRTRSRYTENAARQVREVMRKNRSPAGAPCMSKRIMQEFEVFEQAQAAFTIDGAPGSAGAVNGAWYSVGVYNGKPRYQNMAGGFVLWQDGSGNLAGNDWAFQNVGAAGKAKWTLACDDQIRYYNQLDSATPPSNGWTPGPGFATGAIKLLYEVIVAGIYRDSQKHNVVVEQSDSMVTCIFRSSMFNVPCSDQSKTAKLCGRKLIFDDPSGSEAEVLENGDIRLTDGSLWTKQVERRQDAGTSRSLLLRSHRPQTLRTLESESSDDVLSCSDDDDEDEDAAEVEVATPASRRASKLVRPMFPKPSVDLTRRHGQDLHQCNIVHTATQAYRQSARMPPVFCFQGFADYKNWQNPSPHSRHERGKQEMVKVAAESPQIRWSSAIREHEAAAQWRRARKANAVADGGPLVNGSDHVRQDSTLPSVPQSARGASEMRNTRSASVAGSRPMSTVSMAQDLPTPATPQPLFHRPWSRGEKRREEDQEDEGVKAMMEAGGQKGVGPIERFAKICRHVGVHPQPCTIRFLTALPPKMEMRGVGFADEDLLSLAAALPLEAAIEAVDLGENPRLTDNSVCTLLRILALKRGDIVARLDLDRCARLGRGTIELCSEFLRGSFAELQSLNISGIQVPLRAFKSLSEAIQQHKKLKDVRLAETGLGIFDRRQGQTVVANLVAVSQLEYLDIGWNSLDGVAFQTLGKGLMQHEHLRSVGLSNTGTKLDSVLGGSPVLVFLEFLEKDNSLTYVDLSNNGFDENAALALECAACRHPKLKHIDLSQNPLGLGARRSVIRLLASVGCPELVRITTNECRGGQSEVAGKTPFALDPSGNWSLNMAQPAQRSLLKLLLMRFSEGIHALKPEKLLKNAILCREDGVEVPFSVKDSLKRKGEKQVWEVPTAGKLNFEFSAGEILLKDLDQKKSPADVVWSIIEKTRLKLQGRRKTLAVLSVCKGEQDEEDRGILLEALSRDFILTPEQVKALCHTQAPRPNCAKDPGGTCCRLLPCLMGPAHVRQAILCTHNFGELMRVHTHGHSLLSLHLDNPTGRYDFALSEPPDRATAERLLLLNRWEAHVWLPSGPSGKIDISQHLNLKNVRNEMYDNSEFVWSAEEWGIFGSKSLSFDYTSLRRPPESAQVLNNETWEAIIDHIKMTLCDTLEGNIEELVEKDEPVDPKQRKRAAPKKKEADMRFSNVNVEALKGLKSKKCGWDRGVVTSLSDKDVLWALRACSSRVWVLCSQIRRLLCVFPRREARQEVVTYLCLRAVDWPFNSKLLRPKFSAPAWEDLRRRLGTIVMFPFFQPENTSFQFDLSINEQRRCLNFMTALAATEHHKNIKYPRIDWRGYSSSPEWDSFVAGIPITWKSFDSIPSKGLFEATYTCSMDHVDLKKRRALAQEVGGWSNLPQTKMEMEKWTIWWQVLDDVPREVVMVLEFLMSCQHFKNLAHAFDSIDVNKDRTLTYREFMSGMKRKMRELGFGFPSDSGKKRQHKVEDAEEDKSQDKSSNEKDPPERADGAPAEVKADDDKKNDRDKEEKKRGRKGGKRDAQLTVKSSQTDDPRQLIEKGFDDERLTEILHTTFKFLDPNNDAELSYREFEVLLGIWRELQLTMWEFVQHIVDCFGSLPNAWAYADEDGNNSLDYQEFESLARKWHFDGPVRQIFMYLDRDGNGAVGLNEWLQLDRFEKEAWPLDKPNG